MLAVRKPSTRPSRPPAITLPLIRKSRPRSALASSNRPAATASRTRVELTGRPSPGVAADAGRAARTAQRLHVASSPAPEPESFADHHLSRPHRPDQYPLDELLGVQGCERRVEAQHTQLVDAVFRDPLRLVAQPHEPRRRHRRREELLRLGLEAGHGRRDPRFTASLLQHRQDRLVPEMHAVEVADRDGPAGVRVRAGSDSASNQHGLPDREIVPGDYRCFRSRGRAPASARTPK
jgi:hypothetical protein